MQFTYTIPYDQEYEDCLYRLWGALRRCNPLVFSDVSERNLVAIQHHLDWIQKQSTTPITVDLYELGESIRDISTEGGYHSEEGRHAILLRLEQYRSGEYEQIAGCGTEDLLIKVHSPLYHLFKTRPMPDLVGMQLRLF